MADDQAQFESPEEAIEQEGGDEGRGLVKLWISAIDASTKEEDDWRKEGDEVVALYRSGKKNDAKVPAFNILFSNTETILPAVYNSTPNPDIRRRYNDDSPISKAVVDLLERGIVYSLDQYDFDAAMRMAIFDAIVPGRGICRVRYAPTMEGEEVTDEQVVTEYVPWKNFRRGAGLTWGDVPWVAFEQYLTREQLEQLSPEIGATIPLDCTTTGEDVAKDTDGQRDASDIMLRARVWEIWDKQTKQVLFISPSHPASPILREDDPLGLTGFYPIPRPIQPIEVTNDLTPVPVYRAYQPLAEELNEITARIRRLTAQIRVRALYASSTPDLDKIITADDGDLVPVAGLEMFAQGGLDKALAWWPIEPAIKALQQLYVQRDAVKATIYEVSGLSDILRGASNASETATAQQIKSQWGSLRIQRMQAEVARFIRDIFRMKGEILATKFDIQRLVTMAGVELTTQQDKAVAQAHMQQMQGQPPEAMQGMEAQHEQIKKTLELPTIEEVGQLLQNDLMRSYKVDVESDSTIRADLARNQEAMVGFVQGTAQYIQAMGPAVQSGLMPPDLAVDIYASFARTFKLGKQVEDSLEKAASQAREKAQQPPAPPPPDPAVMQAQQEMQLAQAKMQSDMQMKQTEMQGRAELEMAKLDLEREKIGAEFAMKREQMQADLLLTREQHSQKAMHADEMHSSKIEQMKKGKNPDASVNVGAEMGDSLEPLTQALAMMGEMMAQQSAEAAARHEAMMQQMAQMAALAAAPKMLIRNRNGQVAGVATDTSKFQ